MQYTLVLVFVTYLILATGIFRQGRQVTGTIYLDMTSVNTILEKKYN